MNNERKQFIQAEIEVITFDEKDDIRTEFSSITLGGEGFIDDDEDDN